MSHSKKVKLNLCGWNMIEVLALVCVLMAGCKTVSANKNSSLQGSDQEDKNVNLLVCVVGLTENSDENKDLARISLVTSSNYTNVLEAKLMQTSSNSSVIFKTVEKGGIPLKNNEDEIEFRFDVIAAPKAEDFGHFRIKVAKAGSTILSEFVSNSPYKHGCLI